MAASRWRPTLATRSIACSQINTTRKRIEGFSFSRRDLSRAEQAPRLNVSSRQVEPQQLTGYFAVEERNARGRRDTNAFGQGRIPREYKSRPARASLLQNFAQRPVEGFQMFFFTNTLHIGWIADDRSGQS